MTFIIIGIIICFVFLICGIVLFYKANQIKINKNKQQEQYKQKLENEVHNLQIDRNNLITSEIYKKQQLQKDFLQFKQQQEKKKKALDEQYSQWKSKRRQQIQEYIKNQQLLAIQTIEKTQNKTKQTIAAIHTDLNNIRESAIQQKQEIQNDIDKLKASLSAGVQARLREQQINDKLDFYRLSINDTDLSDVKMLQSLKPSLHKPVILSKLIWTQYFQKQMTELCDRILGKNSVCGIYKITDLITEQCYIGQSVNISDRWKQHCKCGLGIDASTTNKLYNAMQKDGVWNFTFELLEQCPKQLLNEKESFWIQMYQSNVFGYNITKGNKI